MSDKDLAQAIVDWFFENDCTTEKALKAVIRILREANYGDRIGNKDPKHT